MKMKCFEHEQATFHLGNCFHLMKSGAIGSVDCLVTDPPYFTPAKISATRTDFGRSLSNTQVLQDWADYFAVEVGKILSSSAHFYLFCDGRSYPLFYRAFYEMSKDCRSIVWNKGIGLLGYSWRKSHELILFGEMPEAKPVPTGDRDVITMNSIRVGDRHHPAQKPVPLLERLIEKSTKPGDLVFDPFMGSGSTAIACLNTGRRFVGCEVSEKYFGDACHLIKTTNRQTCLLEANNAD